MSDFRKLYNRYEESGNVAQIEEVERAEEEFQRFFQRLTETDMRLAQEIDSLAGKIARAYSIQGFSGGLMAAMEVTA